MPIRRDPFIHFALFEFVFVLCRYLFHLSDPWFSAKRFCNPLLNCQRFHFLKSTVSAIAANSVTKEAVEGEPEPR
jgi:hypothetical protein